MKCVLAATLVAILKTVILSLSGKSQKMFPVTEG